MQLSTLFVRFKIDFSGFGLRLVGVSPNGEIHKDAKPGSCCWAGYSTQKYRDQIYRFLCIEHRQIKRKNNALDLMLSHSQNLSMI